MGTSVPGALDADRNLIDPLEVCGACGSNRLLRDGQERELGGKYSGELQAGDIVIVETPGGGGWGAGDEQGT